jgi:pectinesterase
MRTLSILHSLTALGLSLMSHKILAQSTIQTQLGSNINMIVAKDGSGQYTTVQAAVNAAPNNSTSPTVIFVKKGTYAEKVEIPSTKTFLYLIGEDAAGTVIVNGDYTGSTKIYNGLVTAGNGLVIGTSTSHTLYVAANDFTMMNITIQNNAGDVGQAVAFNSKGDRHFLFHCRLLGYQDTYYTWGTGRYYIKDNYIEGAIDYIFGNGVALFDSCQVHSLRSSSYITAASTAQNFKFGYVFNNCKLTGASGISSVFLGRPWKAYAQTVFMNSEEGSFLSSAGWSPWSGTTNDQTCYYAEYKDCGAGSGTSNRVSWSHQLTASQAATYTKVNLFDKSSNPTPYAASWNPIPENDILYKIIKKNTTRFITSACFPPIVTGMEEETISDQSTCFPNPFSSECHIRENGRFEYDLFDLTGQLVETGKGENTATMGAALQTGVYLVKIQSSSGTRFIKVIKK